MGSRVPGTRDTRIVVDTWQEAFEDLELLPYVLNELVLMVLPLMLPVDLLLRGCELRKCCCNNVGLGREADRELPNSLLTLSST